MVDPQLQTLGAQLGEVVVRNTAFAIADKSELVRIANAYEDELVAQRLGKEDIEYISKNLVPLLGEVVASSAQPEQAKAFQDVVQKLLSVETVTVLQLVGFNFRKAIGEPLTELVAGFIAARTSGNTSDKTAVVLRTGKRHR